MEFALEKYYLKSATLLDFLSADEKEEIKTRMVRREFQKGEYLFKEKSLSRGIYIMRKGRVKIFQTDDEGRQNIVYFYRKGDFFGHRPILANEPHPASAVAMEPVVVSFISKEHFLKLLGKSDSLAKELLTILSREFSVWMNMTTLFANYGVKKRVAVSLLVLNRVYAKPDSAAKRTVISINRDDFAGYVGTAKETLVRMLRFFKDEGIISANRTNITILKPRLLMSMVENM